MNSAEDLSPEDPSSRGKHRPNEEQGDFHCALRNFIERDYHGCVGAAYPILLTRPAHEVLQLILISLLRSSETLLAEQIGAVAIEDPAEQPWVRRLVELTLGRVDPSVLRDLAVTDLQRCQLLYYSGSRQLTVGQIDGAVRDFEACREIEVYCLERLLARVEDPHRAPIDQTRLGPPAELISPAVDRMGTEGMSHFARGEDRAAEPLLRKVLEECHAKLGIDHPWTAAALSNLAMVYRRLTAPQGEGMSQELRQLRDQILSRPFTREEFPDFAAGLHTQAEIRMTGSSRMTSGSLDDAERIARGAAAIRRVVLGEAHPDYAKSLRLSASFANSRDDLVVAGSLYRQALEIHTVMLGEADPETIKSLLAFGRWQAEMGDYTSADSLIRRALQFHSDLHSEWDEDLVDILRALIGLTLNLGDVEEADHLSRRLVEVARRVFGEDHEDYIESLRTRAEVIQFLGQGERASCEQLLQEALKYYRKQADKGYRPYGNTLVTLAHLYMQMGRYGDARLLLDEAQRHDPGPRCLNSLGVCLWRSGDLEAAESPLRQALQARSELGEDHADVAPILSNLGGLYASMGRPAEALSLLRRSESIVDRIIGQAFSLGSDRRRMAILAKFRGNLDGFLSMVVSHSPGSPEAVEAAYDLVLRRKAIGAEALAAQRDAVLSDRYPDLQHRLREWFHLREQIALKSLAGPGPEGQESHRRQIAKLAFQMDQLESDLARHIPEMNLEIRLRAADHRAVANGLPEGSTLVEFVRFDVFDYHAVPARGEPLWLPARYLAFVLPAGKPDRLRLIDLGEARPIDKLIMDFRAELLGEGAEDTGRDMVVRHRPSPSNEVGSGEALRAALLDPLTSSLGDRTRLLLAPDGALSRLPFEVLPTADGRLVMDRYAPSYLGCGRDVLRFSTVSTGKPAAALVAADPDFDLGGGCSVLPAPLVQSQERRSSSLDSLKFPVDRLPSTRIEGERIASRLGVQPWVGAAVLEGRLKSKCRSPFILHLATHGFFLEDQERDPIRAFGGIGGLIDPVGGPERLSGPLLENPLLRAGLVLAGANTWHRTGQHHPEAEDGLLTAEDVTRMDLLATELVVLSACETGLGEIYNGEGVFGLQRAFVLAGAKTLVMSLWAVPDLPTAILMDRFYANLLDRCLGRAEALRDAQNFVRTLNLGSIRDDWLSPAMISRLAADNAAAEADLRALYLQPDDRRPFADPYYWGAFVCLGDPAAFPTSNIQ